MVTFHMFPHTDSLETHTENIITFLSPDMHAVWQTMDLRPWEASQNRIKTNSSHPLLLYPPNSVTVAILQWQLSTKISASQFCPS